MRNKLKPLNSKDKNLVIGGAFVGFLLSLAGNLFVTSFYDIFAQNFWIKHLILIDSGLGLLVLVILFSGNITPIRR